MTVSQGFSSIGSYMEFSSVLPADELAVTYAALTWTPSDEEVTIGEWGNKNEVITYNTIKNGVVNKRLGSADAGSVPAEFAYVGDNAAQVLLTAANDNKTPVAVKEVLANGDVSYFTAYVSSAITAPGSSSDITMFKASLEITTPIVTVLSS